MTEVTGVIIARVVAMITVVTGTTKTVTKNDVTGTGTEREIEAEVIGLGMIDPEIGHQDGMEIAVLQEKVKESEVEMIVSEVGDLLEIQIVHDLQGDQKMNAVEQKLGGGMKKIREDDTRKTKEEQNSGNKLKLKVMSKIYSLSL